MYVCMNGSMSVSMHELVDRWTYGEMYACMDGWIHVCMNVDARMGVDMDA